MQFTNNYDMRKNNFKMAKYMESLGYCQKKAINNENLKYGLAPWVGVNPTVLILGTLPSDDSIKSGLYYQNPTNRFWEIMHIIFGGDIDDHSKDFIISQKIALWDCFRSAQRKDSADKNIIVGTETPNDILSFLKEHPTINCIILNGTTKHPKSGYSTITAFNKYFYDLYDNYMILCLPQTSSRNERFGKTMEEKINKWSIVRKLVDEPAEVQNNR